MAMTLLGALDYSLLKHYVVFSFIYNPPECANAILFVVLRGV